MLCDCNTLYRYWDIIFEIATLTSVLSVGPLFKPGGTQLAQEVAELSFWRNNAAVCWFSMLAAHENYLESLKNKKKILMPGHYPQTN